MTENINTDTELVFDILGNDAARRILELTSEEPYTAEELEEECQSSLPTVYRHLKTLTMHDFVEGTVQFDDEGHRYTEYEANLAALAVTLEEGELGVRLRRRQMSEGFEAFWREFEQGNSDA